MLKAKNINKRFDDDGHDDDDEMNDAFAWACHHMCFSLCQSMNALLRQGCHQKQKYIIANITTRSTNISSPILSSKAQIYHRQYCHQKHKYIIANIVSSVEWKTCKQLYEPCSSCTISGPHLFKLNQELALIMNLLTL